MATKESMDDDADEYYEEDDEMEPEYWHCTTCRKTFLKDPCSNPCWDGGCSIEEVG